MPRLTLLRTMILTSVFSVVLPASLEGPPKPTCHLRQGTVEAPCAYFRLPTRDYRSKKWAAMVFETSQATTITLPSGENYTYVNATYKFLTPQDTVTWAELMINLSDGNSSAWEIKARDSPGTLPATLVLAYLPEPEEKPIAKKFPNYDKTPNIREEDEELLSIMHNINFTFKPYHVENYIELIFSDKNLPDLNVELIAGQCNITCVDGLSTCDINTTNFRLNTSRGDNKLAIHDLQPSFYCARISPADRKCCTIATYSIQISDVRPGNKTVNTNDAVGPFIYTISTAILALFAALVFCIIKTYLKRGQNSPNAQEAAQESLIEVNELEARANRSADNDQSRLIEVLLLYYREHNAFVEVMKEFRNILKNHGLQVWDPFDEDHNEAVSANPNAWMEEKLQREEIRILLLETTVGVAKQKAIITGRDSPQIQHYLDDVFIYALSSLQFNPCLCRNYKRLFVVRFDFTPHDEQYANTVSFTRYQVPDNISSLLTDIMGYENSNAVTRPTLIIDTNTFCERLSDYVNNTNQ